MKIQAQPEYPEIPSIFSMAAARRPPKEPESAAAEKKIASMKVNLRETGKKGGGSGSYSSDTKFRTPVPTGKVVVNAREQTSLRQTEEPASSHQTVPALYEAHSKHASAPRNPVILSAHHIVCVEPFSSVTSNLHDNWDEPGRSHTLQENVGKRLKDRIRDKKDGEAGVVLRGGDAYSLRLRLDEASDLRVANVGPVEEGEQIKQT